MIFIFQHYPNVSFLVLTQTQTTEVETQKSLHQKATSTLKTTLVDLEAT